MTIDRPEALELLREARRTLLEELAPACQGKDRFKALMIANALGIVQRDMELRDSASDGRLGNDIKALGYKSEKALVTALREGGAELSPKLHRVLLGETKVRVSISNPKAL